MACIVIFPSGNSFSHLRECELIGADLLQNCHNVHFGISRHYESWAKNRGLEYSVVPELWERGPTDHPNVSWFIDHEYLSACIRSEIDLIDKCSPDFILADFKYTAGISARACGVPLITKTIIAMLPETKANFGYLSHDVSPASLQQQKYLNFFDYFACVALNKAAQQFGLEPFHHMADFLDGDWVLIPDSPWFHKVAEMPEHYLPINILHQSRCAPSRQAVNVWGKNNHGKNSIESCFVNQDIGTIEEEELGSKTVFLALGSVCRSRDVLIHLTSALGQGPWNLYVSMSGENVLLQDELKKKSPRARIAAFWEFEELVNNDIDLYVCHGGLGSIFNGIEYAVPLLIAPLQPEQDHNGLLVETHGVGTRIGASHICSGRENLYVQTILETREEAIAGKVRQVLLDRSFKTNSLTAKEMIEAEMNHLPSVGEALQKIINSKAAALPEYGKVAYCQL